MTQEEVSKEVSKEVVAEVKKGTAPDYKGDGVSVWVNIDKNGKEYLAIQVLKNKPIHAFKYEAKTKVEGGDSQ